MDETAAVPVKARELPGLRRVVRWLAVLAVPASLFSPGATVAAAAVAICGLIFWARGAKVDSEIARAGRYTIALYLLPVTVDLLNGGSFENEISSVFNYSHLLAIAPFALALREAKLEHKTFDRAMQATVLIAVVAALAQFFVYNVARPGGLFLNPIPFGFVLSLWGVFLLSRGLEEGRNGTGSIVIAGLAFIPVLLTESKIAWACMLLGYAIVLIWWAISHGRQRALLVTLAAAVPLLYLAFHFLAYRRLDQFVAELELFLGEGTLTENSFGWRYELATSGLRAFWEHPFLGYGLDQRMDAVLANTSPGGPDISHLTHIHNDYVTHLVAFGVSGIVFVGLFLAFVWCAAVNCRDIGARRAGVALTLMLALYMVFEVAFNMDPVSGAVTVALGILLLRPWAQQNATNEPN